MLPYCGCWYSLAGASARLPAACGAAPHTSARVRPCNWCTPHVPPFQVAAPKLHIGADAALVVQAPQAQIRSLDVQRGTLLIRAAPEGAGAAATPAAPAAAHAAGAAGVVVDGVTVDNAGWEWRALDPDAGASEEEYIRGFRVVRHDQTVLP